MQEALSDVRLIDSGYPYPKKLFRQGFPPAASVFDTEFYERRASAYEMWMDTIEEVERLLSITSQARDGFLHVARTAFAHQDTILATSNASYIGRLWRKDYARFLSQHFDTEKNWETLWVLFLLSSREKNFKIDDSTAQIPLSYLAHLAV